MSKLLVTLVAAPLALLSTHALAMNSTAATSAASRNTEAVQTPRLSLEGAVRVAHAEMQGRILGVRFEMWRGQPSYLVRIYTSRSLPAVWQGRINANTALPIGQPTMFWSHQWDSRLRKSVVALRAVRTPLDQVVRKAKRTHGGEVIMVAVRALPNGRAAYQLNLVSNDQVHVLTIS